MLIVLICTTCHTDIICPLQTFCTMVPVKLELLESMDHQDPSLVGGLVAATMAPQVPGPMPTLMEDSLQTEATAGDTCVAQ